LFKSPENKILPEHKKETKERSKTLSCSGEKRVHRVFLVFPLPSSLAKWTYQRKTNKAKTKLTIHVPLSFSIYPFTFNTQNLVYYESFYRKSSLNKREKIALSSKKKKDNKKTKTKKTYPHPTAIYISRFLSGETVEKRETACSFTCLCQVFKSTSFQ